MRGASAWRDSKVQSEVEFFAIPFLTLTISPREKILSVCVLDIGERTSSLEDIENDAPGWRFATASRIVKGPFNAGLRHRRNYVNTVLQSGITLSVWDFLVSLVSYYDIYQPWNVFVLHLLRMTIWWWHLLIEGLVVLAMTINFSIYSS